MTRRARAWVALLFTISWICLLSQIHAPPTSAVPVVACAPALELAGHLQCDVVTLNRVCGALSGLRSGDVIAGPPCAVVGRMAGQSLAALEVPVDVNTASLAELESLPGIGPRLAERITAARPFLRVDDLDRVQGIGPVRLAGMRRRVRVEIPAVVGPRS